LNPEEYRRVNQDSHKKQIGKEFPQMKRVKRTFATAATVLFLSTLFFGESIKEPLRVLDAYIQKSMQEWQAPGIAVGIVKNDRVIFSKGYGFRELGKPDRVDSRTIFAVGSQGKAFTAAAIAMLVDEGKLSWDDEVIAYVPELKLYDPWVTRELRIRDLLCHRIGIKRSDPVWYMNNYSQDKILYLLRFIQPDYSFRSRFGYHNMIFVPAGKVITALTGLSWKEFVKQRIFHPLNMSQSSTSITEFKQDDPLASPHEIINETAQSIRWQTLDNIAPAGAINSTVDDMMQWLRLQLGKGIYQEKRLISSTAIEEMHSPQTIISIPWLSKVDPVWALMASNSNFFMYGLGWFCQDYHGVKLVHHGGEIDGMRCQVGMIPEKNVGIVIFVNLHPTPLPEAIMYKFFDISLGIDSRDWSAEMLRIVRSMSIQRADSKRKMAKARFTNTKPSLALEDYTGSYENKIYGKAKVTMEDMRLLLHIGKYSGDLEHWHFDTFTVNLRRPSIMPLELITFKLNILGKAEKFHIPGLGDFQKVLDKK
jgi:CubicO group peptidase (beta-lactamase class C family)